MHPDIEILYVYPREKSSAMGEGVYQTEEGANFKFIDLPEKFDAKINSLYFVGLETILKKFKPDIILLLEFHIKSFMHYEELKKIVKEQNIKLILKSIPFRVKNYNEINKELRRELKNMPVPIFKSIPFYPRKLLVLMRINILYKKLILDKSLYKKHILDKPKLKKLSIDLNLQKALFNFPDAHVNYIKEAYQILGSYSVPKKKIFITYNSPDTDLYFSVKAKISKEPPILQQNDFRIVHLSRLVEWKKVDMLITAIANLKTDFPKIELLVLGDGPEMEKLVTQSLRLNVQDHVKFLGGVYDIELLGKYLMCSSIYVLAGMGGLSINDAMIFELPVICSVCDGTEKHLVIEGYNGLYFEEGSQSSLESRIRYLFNNPIIRSKMGRNSLKIIQDKINITTVVRAYIRAFNFVLPREKKVRNIN
jgi:glycosyltransferase involved in cell wall biosynthesis